MVSENSPRKSLLTALIFFSGVISTAPALHAQNGSDRPKDQPADLSNVEQQAEQDQVDKKNTVEQEEPIGSEDIQPQKVRREREPTPQIRKKNEDYDPRYQQGVRYIEHPMAAKGLYLIDKNKVYYYRVKPTEATQEGSVRVGYYNPSQLSNPSYPNLTFGDLYSNTIPIILYDNEIDIFKKFGRFGWKYGAGVFFEQGHGSFVEQPEIQAVAAGRQGPPEQFTFFMFPLNIGVIYHLEYFKNQWIIPYGEGGVDAFCFGEARDDSVNTFGAAFGLAGGVHFSGGVAIPLGHDYRSFLDMDREYGITKVSFVAEFREYVSLEPKWNFTAPAMSAGFSVNY